MKKLASALAITSTLLLSGCMTVVQNSQPASLETNKTVTVIDDTRTRDGVRDSITAWLTKQGYQFEVVETPNYVLEYDQAIVYQANWAWDITTYMRYADISLYNKNNRIGNVRVDTVGCGGFGKFGNAAERISLSMDLLFNKIDSKQAEKLICKA